MSSVISNTILKRHKTCVLEDTEETKQSYNEMQSTLDKMTTNDIKHQRKDAQ